LDEILSPATDWELQSMIASLAADQTTIEVVGAASMRAIGRPITTDRVLTTSVMRGIPLYESTELVMSARAGTPLVQIEAELAARNQMLAFEPIDLGPMLGQRAGLQTIGSIFAANLSGSRRILVGAARDHLLGVKAVNGRGELFKSGGRVMKNVTGYDVARGLTGSWGTLAVLAEVTFKVMPVPEDIVTLLFPGLPDDLAVEMMCAAHGTPFEISATVHLPERLVSRLEHQGLQQAQQSITAIRLENFTKSIAYRKEKLSELLAPYGAPAELDFENSLKFWGELRHLSVLPASSTNVWRISTAPMQAPKIVHSISRHMDVNAMYDWSGGLVWLETPESADAGAADIRRAVAVHGGYATLIRADRNVRSQVEVFQPLAPVADRLSRQLKATFDPHGILNGGRMYADV
jgi:glycolate dehydrogenase FAD-binding subunit